MPPVGNIGANLVSRPVRNDTINVSNAQDVQQSGSGVSAVRPDVVRAAGRQEVPRADLSKLRAQKQSPLKEKLSQYKPMHLAVSVPPDNSSAVVSASTLTSKEIHSLTRVIKKMLGNERFHDPADGRIIMHNALADTLQPRINNGAQLYQSIMSGEQVTSDKDAVRDLMTFLSVRAQQKSVTFSEGAFVLEDQGGRLKNFLDRNPEGYIRASTHIKEYQAAGNTHRGIDMELPFAKGTLLYGAMPADTPDGKDRVFLKMEPHGAALSKLFGRNSGVEAASRRFKWADIGHFLRHIKTTIFRPKEGGSRKERVSTDIKKGFTNLIADFKKVDPEFANILNEGNPAGSNSGLGVARMMRNCQNAQAALSRIAQRLGLDSQIVSDCKEQLQQFSDTMKLRYDNISLRVGDEIVFTNAELTNVDESRSTSIEGLTRALCKHSLSLPQGATPTANFVQKFAVLLTRLTNVLPDDQEVEDDSEGPLAQSLSKELQTLSDEQRKDIVDLLQTPQMLEFSKTVGDTLTMAKTDAEAGVCMELLGGISTLADGVGLNILDVLERTAPNSNLDSVLIIRDLVNVSERLNRESA
ncbi:hypothetical protein [Halodesulfovibrio marinisediminis]|uniref:Uncharacterized protein n=1 Tax=Halodesulfovibrio marinisediminis DSM 17456 TaxID=1121457 RepID=A0A1N6HY91_9BACT|nr:hypothetical protein [Halodesulfovibrio marinisediminis]SIO24756.1 hypothetical protein SAMN02745161_2275 [Halodesulfovibrio marinisediminis DSM 17456]